MPEINWRAELEKKLGRMVTQTEWESAKDQIMQMMLEDQPLMEIIKARLVEINGN